MKSWFLRLAVLFLGAGLVALIIAGVMLLSREDTPDSIQPSSPAMGWHDGADGKYFIRDDGTYMTGLFPCPQGTYYFNGQGQMVTGWQSFAEGTRYFAQDGRMNVGFLELDGKRYCFDRDGLLCVGWRELAEARYYFHTDGTMATGLTQTPEGYYFFSDEGHMRTGWQETATAKHYFKEDGSAYTGWLQTDEARYYFLEDGKMATGLVNVAGIQRLFSSDGNYIPLVNAQHTVPPDYIFRPVKVDGLLVDSTCADALRRLVADARREGLACVLNSTYRDIATQEYLWNRRYNDYLSKGYSPEEAYALSIRRVMYPGASEHHTGLAIDIKETVENGALYAWFNAHAWEYGFILRYKGEKENYTGVRDEPWHLRYVGVELAKELWERDLCLEEYLLERNQTANR